MEGVMVIDDGDGAMDGDDVLWLPTYSYLPRYSYTDSGGGH